MTPEQLRQLAEDVMRRSLSLHDEPLDMARLEEVTAANAVAAHHLAMGYLAASTEAEGLRLALGAARAEGRQEGVDATLRALAATRLHLSGAMGQSTDSTERHRDAMGWNALLAAAVARLAEKCGASPELLAETQETRERTRALMDEGCSAADMWLREARAEARARGRVEGAERMRERAAEAVAGLQPVCDCHESKRTGHWRPQCEGWLDATDVAEQAIRALRVTPTVEHRMGVVISRSERPPLVLEVTPDE